MSETPTRTVAQIAADPEVRLAMRRSGFNASSLLAKGRPNDPDARATAIAKKYIGLMTDMMKNEFKVMPLTGVEVNFMADGVDNTALMEYITQETREVQNLLGRKTAQQYEADAATLREKLLGIQVFADGRPNPEADALEKSRKDDAKPDTQDTDLTYLFQLSIASFLEDPDRFISTQAGFYLLIESMLKEDHPEILETLNPKFKEAFHRYCVYLKYEALCNPASGAFYKANQQPPDTPDDVLGAPELCTPPRAPLHTIAQVEAIKRILLESSYLFYGAEDASPIAKRIRKKFGDIAIRGIQSQQYFNHAEHINVSLSQVSEEHNPDYRGLGTNPQRLQRFNQLNSLYNLYVYSSFLSLYLPADRILTIGNHFPYDEARHEAALSDDGKAHVHLKSDRLHRDTGRIEIRNFNDASSNISLSMLSVVSTLLLAQFALKRNEEIEAENPDHAIKSHDELAAFMEREFFITPAHMPTCAKEGVDAFTAHRPRTSDPSVPLYLQSPSLKMMDTVAQISSRRTDGSIDMEKLAAMRAEIEEFKVCVVKRQAQVLKPQWGGKGRAGDIEMSERTFEQRLLAKQQTPPAISTNEEGEASAQSR